VLDKHSFLCYTVYNGSKNGTIDTDISASIAPRHRSRNHNALEKHNVKYVEDERSS
jgi:hypothetical protein